MIKNHELEFLKKILKTEKEKELLEWISQELTFEEILKKIKDKKESKDIG